MGKIGFVTVAHPDYLGGGHVKRVSGLAVDAIEGDRVALYNAGIAMDVPGAIEAGKRLVHEDVDGVVVFLGSWMECSTMMALVREVEHLPLCMWGFPMWHEDGAEYSTGSYVSYVMFKGVLDRLNWPFFGVLDMPGAESAGRVAAFCAAAIAYQKLKRARLGLVGYTSMSIYTGTFDHVLMRAKIGPEVEHIDAYTLIQIAEGTTDEAKAAVVRRMRKVACPRADVSEESLRKAAGLYLALMDLKDRLHLDAVNVKCQYEFSKEYAMTMCVPLSLASDDGLTACCEGDTMCAASMMMLHYLSGQVAAYGDAINHEGGVLKLSPCGFMPYSLGAGALEITNFMPGCGFSGIQNSFVMHTGRVTILRLIEDVGGYHIVYLTGEGLPTQKRQGLMPALDVRPDNGMEGLLKHYSGQHYALCYGDLSGEVEALARILKVPAIRV